MATTLLAEALDGQVKSGVKCPHFMKVCDAQQLLQETKLELEESAEKPELNLYVNLGT